MLKILGCALRDSRYYYKLQFSNQSISIDTLKDIKKVKMKIKLLVFKLI
tara:strand:+ start:589 stop:735 length:147 start_codon:yes stop_codon:yes gene_type:complete